MSVPEINQLRQLISECMITERSALLGRLRKLCQDDTAGLEAFSQQVSSALMRVKKRRQVVPEIQYDQALPVVDRKCDLATAIRDNQVIVVAGETGSGKTTQLPKICLEVGRGIYGQIGHTQPRRLAARAVASRIAEELHVPLGEQVGYKVRFTDQANHQTLIKLMTDGILLAEIHNDRFLSQYDTLIIDEAHERSLNVDFLLAYLKLILPKRPDLKVIITSATIDVNRFSMHFNNAPIIEVSGRAYPVEVHYRPMEKFVLEGMDADQCLQQGLLSVLGEITEYERSGKGVRLGDVLVFLSGERDIRETAKFLRDAHLPNTEILPLYARLTATEQSRIFQAHSGRRVILSTNIAETSLTVPGIRYVIDPGTARISRYSVKSKIQRLPIEAISQASANQRKGRCGRIADGICFRLYSEEDFFTRPEYTDAEIFRTNLAAVILQMLGMGLGDISRFPFVDKPDSKAINDGFKLLQELGAVNSQRRLTAIGHQLAKLQVDPRLGRMLIEGQKNNVLSESLIIVSALSIQDPRERPADKKQASDQRHKEHYHDESDFMTFVNLWNSYEKHRQEFSQNQLRKYCHQQFLSFMRMREWRDVHRQLAIACRDLKYSVNKIPGDYADVHKALLSGLLSLIGNRDDEADYMGSRNRRFFLFPTSTLFKRKPQWIVSSELIETSRLFGRINAKIDSQWIEGLASDLVKRNYFEPHWEKKRAQVVAFEQVTLYGLTIISRRKVNYGAIDPVVSRELFIRDGLVGGQYESKGLFQAHNNALIADIDQLEAKARRKDILVDPETLYAFYDERISVEVVTGASFEKWRKDVECNDKHRLMLSREYLMKHNASLVTEARYPDAFSWKGLELPLSYHFVPGDIDDGVTLTLPVQALRLLPKHRLEWLVPGMLFDKCVAMIRALPKALRKNFVPVPDFVNGALETLFICDEPLTKNLSKQLTRMTGVDIVDDDWQLDTLDNHFFINIKVLDEEGMFLGQGRNIDILKEKYEQQAETSIRKLSSYNLEQEGLTEWSCGELPAVIVRDYSGLQLKLYPALVDKGCSVAVRMFENSSLAEKENRLGLVRLLILRLATQLKFALSKMPCLKETRLLAMNLVNNKELDDDLQSFLVSHVFLRGKNYRPSSREEFDELVERCKADLVPQAEKVDDLLHDIFKRALSLTRVLKGKNIPFDKACSMADIKKNLGSLIHGGFIYSAGWDWLIHYPRYIEAMALRLEKLPIQINKDRQWTEELGILQSAYSSRLELLNKHKLVDENIIIYRWMLEEYRVSLFAQQLGTCFPISDKRLRKAWLNVQDI